MIDFIKKVLLGVIVLVVTLGVGFTAMYIVAHILMFLGWDLIYRSLLAAAALILCWKIGDFTIEVAKENKNEPR